MADDVYFGQGEYGPWMFEQGRAVHSVCGRTFQGKDQIHILRLPLISPLHSHRKGVFSSLYHSQVTSNLALSLRFVTLILYPFMCCISLKSPHTRLVPQGTCLQQRSQT